MSKSQISVFDFGKVVGIAEVQVLFDILEGSVALITFVTDDSYRHPVRIALDVNQAIHLGSYLMDCMADHYRKGTLGVG